MESAKFKISFAALALVLGSCDREARETRGQPLPETGPMLATTTTLTAGGRNDPPPDPRAAKYEQNAYHISQGQQLYDQFNCTGCHANGGGDIGPALMDEEWIYGGKMEQIVATLIQGRPNGMPSFRDKLTEQQMWQIAAYVRSMSGNVPKDAAASRSDTMANTKPLTLTDRKPVIGASSTDPEGTR